MLRLNLDFRSRNHEFRFCSDAVIWRIMRREFPHRPRITCVNGRRLRFASDNSITHVLISRREHFIRPTRRSSSIRCRLSTPATITPACHTLYGTFNPLMQAVLGCFYRVHFGFTFTLCRMINLCVG